MRLRLLLLLALPALAQVSATVDVNTSSSTPLNANFSGFNDEIVFPAEYFDYRLNDLAAQLSPGWIRYPSGLFSDAFNWQTGQMTASWANQFANQTIGSIMIRGVPWADGKGGGSFVDAANRANFLAAKLIVCVNAYTDTPQSAGAMAAFAKANRIPVAVWELANEPYLTTGFFSSGADYAAKMKPFRDAIKAADPSAVVAIFFDDAGNTSPNPPWDQSLGGNADKYWDAVTYHHYPPQSTGPFSQWMADENAVLVNKTNTYVSGHLAPLNPAGMKFLISEFLPSADGLGAGTSVTAGTLYGAVYAAEYVMRISSVPNMLNAGMHALTGTRGVYAANQHYTDVQNAYNAGTSIDTLSLDFGFYTVAQPLGLAVLNAVLRNAALVESTAVTGGPTVAATGLGQIPAVYAQAYATGSGQQSLVVTNKGAVSAQINVRLNGSAVAGPFNVQSISGPDPTAQNTAANPNAVSVQSSVSTNPVTIPPYSVVRMDLNAPSVATPVNSASYAAGPAAAQEIVTVFGSQIAGPAVSASLPLPDSLGGLSVQISDSAGNTQSAPIIDVVPGAASIVIPSGLVQGPAKLVAQQGATTLTASLTIASSAPGLYTMNSDGAGVAAAYAFRITAASETVNETLFTCAPDYARSCLATPLSLGDPTDTLYVALYGTGIRGAANVQCYVAGIAVPVLYAGPAATPGLDQVNISIPRSLAGAGDARVYLIADGNASNVAGLSIQ